MKHIAPLAAAFAVATLTAPVFADAPAETKTDLAVGAVRVYDFGALKLHAYETKDPLADECYLVETADGLVMVELAAFTNNVAELKDYVASLGKPLTDIVAPYHPAGAGAWEGVPVHAAEGLGESALVAGFVQAFGDAFDGSLPASFVPVAPGKTVIGGVEFAVEKTPDAFDLVLPAANVYFTHMVGSKTHNILPSVAAMDAMLAQMEAVKENGYALVLTGHDIPRPASVADEKTAYLLKMKELAASASDAASFKAAAREAFPDYAGENYLDMTAAALFPAQ